MVVLAEKSPARDYLGPTIVPYKYILEEELLDKCILVCYDMDGDIKKYRCKALWFYDNHSLSMKWENNV